MPRRLVSSFIQLSKRFTLAISKQSALSGWYDRPFLNVQKFILEVSKRY